MDNIEFSAFQNICRTCMCTYDLQLISDNNIIDVLHFLTGARYSLSDELPQQVCIKCIRTMNEIRAFAFGCKQIHFTLSNCLINFKNNQNSLLNVKSVNTNTIEENINEVEFIGIKEEIIDDQEFTFENESKVELTRQIVVEQEIKSEEHMISYTSRDKNSFESISKPCEDNQESINNELTQEITKKKKNLKQHYNERPYKCEVCIKAFTNSYDLLRHTRVHSDERPYGCDLCSKSFKRRETLNEHKLLHSGLRPFQCDICNQTFRTKSNLGQHKQGHSSECRFKCDVCMKGFKHSASLIRHKVLHSGDCPYHCDVCNKTFPQKTHLEKHMICHSDERLFECDICMKSFKHSTNLIRHKRIHSGEHPLL